jgi:phosphotransferase system, enzyme I, PtsP
LSPPMSYFPIKEDNPFLGWRGIRVTLDHPEIFLVQTRAMLKASEGLNNLRILLPMISGTHELEEALHLIHRAWGEVRDEGTDVPMPPIGVMIEIPAAVYQTKELARMVDFLSVGSNDLTQYLLAVDRNNPRVADLYDYLHPAVLQALQTVVTDAHAEGKPVSICGEMAGDPAAAVLLMAMGFDSLSMNATTLPQVNLSKAQEMLAELMKIDNPQVIHSSLQLALKNLGLAKMNSPVVTKAL